jgi:thioesterase domain-containing protein/malonyl CoA-acyl carrier protein transacylase/SAM-dependent methyltransferase/acyl carrier protein
VQTACSTSLVAAHLAGQSLLNFECDAALAGGVALRLPQARGYRYQEGHIFSRDGRCRAFDADATGTVPSAGAGLVVLRRLADALHDGNQIMAVIRGSALTNDGGEKIGYTAPSLTGQRDTILLALGQSGVDADDLAHVEAHGTGTAIGDAVEVGALTEAFRKSTDRTGYCLLSAVKGNIGHTGSAAGVAGLIKSALLLRHRESVPQAHLRRPNPKLELDSSPFRLARENGPLPGRLAAVSSFGIGGTNAHAILEAAPERVRGDGPTVICLSAPSESALRQARQDLADRLGDRPNPAEVSWTLLSGRRRFAHRFTVHGGDPDLAVRELRGSGPSTVANGREPSVAFLFPGQGALYPGAASAAHALLPEFRRHLDEAIGFAMDRFDLDLAAILDLDGDHGPLRTSLGQQLGLFGIGYALGRQFLDWGVRPAAMLGHSAGEYAAAALAGVWDLTTGLTVVGERALAMRAAEPGGLLAVYADTEVLDLALAGYPAVRVATYGPGQTVLAGPRAELDDLAALFGRDGHRTATVDADRAFHTPAMAAAGDRLAAAITAGRPRSPGLPVISNLTGELADRLTEPGYWVDHLCSPIRLTEGMTALLRDGCGVAVELGPGSTMSGGLRRHPDLPSTLDVIPLLGGEREDRRSAVERGLGRLWAADVAVDWPSVFPVRAHCALPATPLDSRPLAAPEPQAAPEPVATVSDELTTRRWIDTGTQAPEPRTVLRLDEHPATTTVADLLAGPGDPAGETTVCTVHDPEDPAALDEVLAHAHREGTPLVVALAGGTAMPEPGDALVVWAEHRKRTGHTVTVLDLGLDPAPVRPPKPVPGCAVYAWRSGGWWALVPFPEPLLTAPDRPGPVVVAADDPGIVDAWAQSGTRVAATVGPSCSRTPLADLTKDLRWTVQESLSGRAELRTAVDDAAAAQVLGLLTERGLLGGTTGDVVARLDPAGRFPRLAERIARAPEAAGLLTVDGDRLVCTPESAARAEAALRAPELAEVRGLSRLLEHCVRSYPAVFAGEIAPHAVLYHEGSDEQITRWLADNRVALTDEAPCLDALAETVARRYAERGSLRVLEIGAGRGDLTWRIADRLGPGADIDYRFTDVSGLQVRKALRQAEARGLGWLRGGHYDINADPVDQGFAAGSYDLVLGFNVVHVAASVPDALRRLARLLRPDGVLGLVELTTAPLWTHLVYGLLPGWWDYDDELRTDSLHLDASRWHQAIRDAGLDCVTVSPEESADHAVVLGRPSGAATPAAELTRQLGPHRPAAAVCLAGDRTGAAWPEFRRAARAVGVDRVVVLTEDPVDWDGELRRGRFDPPDEPPVPWHHLRVESFDRVTRLSRLLAADLPGTARWRPAPEEPRAAGQPAEEPAVSATLAEPVRADDRHAGLARLWCENLGVGEARPDDDFFRGGGESLALVHLLGEVHRGFGVRIEMARFVETPTFGRLVALVDEQAGAGDPESIPGVLRLSAGGAGLPLFLCAPATGSSLCYRHLAPLLGADRPVYGLDTADTAGGIPGIAAGHVALLRRLRPTGPYLLGGWSAGFAVAHEAAAQLEAAGAEVRLLVSFDGLLPDTRGWPLGVLPGQLFRAARLLAQTGFGRATPVARALGLADGRVSRVEEIAATLSGRHELVRVHNDTVRAMLRYRPSPVRCPALILKAGADAAAARRMAARTARLYPAGAEVCPAPGDHWRMIDADLARPTGELVLAGLRRYGV